MKKNHLMIDYLFGMVWYRNMSHTGVACDWGLAGQTRPDTEHVLIFVDENLFCILGLVWFQSLVCRECLVVAIVIMFGFRWCLSCLPEESLFIKSHILTWCPPRHASTSQGRRRVSALFCSGMLSHSQQVSKHMIRWYNHLLGMGSAHFILSLSMSSSILNVRRYRKCDTFIDQWNAILTASVILYTAALSDRVLHWWRLERWIHTYWLNGMKFASCRTEARGYVNVRHMEWCSIETCNIASKSKSTK